MRDGFLVCCDGAALNFSWAGANAGFPCLTSLAHTADSCAALIGRLHYRADWIDELTAGAACKDRTSDAALALSAYEHWGLRGIRRLEGDFSLAIWDGRSHTLYAARDPMGAYPLFWARQNDHLLLSTSMAALANHGTVLDHDYVTDYFALPFPAIREVNSEKTIYRSVQRVMPGSILAFALPERGVSRQAEWNWLDHIVDPGTVDTDEIAEQITGLLRNAVRERVCGTTAAHLSGGMDSTSIALLARDVLGADSRETPLHGLSLVYNELTSLKRETAYIDAALADQYGIVAHRIPADDLLPYDEIAAAACPDEPHPGLFDLAKDAKMSEVAADLGAATILAGHGGDDVLDVLPFHMADMLRSGSVRAAWKEATVWGRAHNIESWQVFRRFGIDPNLPVRLHGGVRSALRRGLVDWRHQGPGTVAPWIRPEFARSQRVYERSLVQLREVYRGSRPVGLSLAVMSARGLAGSGHRPSLTTPRGIALTYPFTDPRLVSLGLGIRLRYRPTPGEQKALLSRAMRDVLPAQIRARRGKAHFNEVYYRGISRNLASLEALIQATSRHHQDIIDPAILVTCLRQTALGSDHAAAGAMRLDSTLSFLLWLSMREKSRDPEPFTECVRIPLC